MNEEELVFRLKQAWVVPGANPSYHDHMKAKLKIEWPLLYALMEELCR